jgi:hypothetical protein
LFFVRHFPRLDFGPVDFLAFFSFAATLAGLTRSWRFILSPLRLASERNRWSRSSLRVRVFHCFAGSREFNPLVVMFQHFGEREFFAFGYPSRIGNEATENLWTGYAKNCSPCSDVPIAEGRTDGASLCNGLISSVDYCSFAYSDSASFRTGISGSASFQSVRKSL